MTKRHISELAEKAGVTPRTIRYYVQEGLLPPPSGKGQHVHYGTEHYEQLMLIRHLAAQRLSLREIREILEDRDHPKPDPWPQREDVEARSLSSPYDFEACDPPPEASAIPEPAVLDLPGWLAGLRVEKPHYYRGLALFPLHPLEAPAANLLDPLTLAEALEGDLLRIAEVSGGVVGELEAQNLSDRFILLLGGQELVGGKQNRMIARSVLVPPGATTRFPVACMQQGRWDSDAPGFGSPVDISASPRLRRELAGSGPLGSAQAQHGVWRAVAESLEEFACPNASGDYAAIHGHVRPSLEGFRRAFALPAGAIGVAAAIGGRLEAVDLFGHPDLLARHWESLLSGYASDALLSAESPPPTAEEVELLLRQAAGAPVREHRAASDIILFEVSGETVAGSGVAHGTRPIHLALFPRAGARADGGEEETRSARRIRARMAGPARRRGLDRRAPASRFR